MPTSGQNKVRADIFDRFFGGLPFRSGSRLSVEQARRGGRRGGLGGIPPARGSDSFGKDDFPPSFSASDGQASFSLAAYSQILSDFNSGGKFFLKDVRR